MASGESSNGANHAIAVGEESKVEEGKVEEEKSAAPIELEEVKNIEPPVAEAQQEISAFELDAENAEGEEQV